MTDMTLPHPGDRFPALTVAVPGGRALRRPHDAGEGGLKLLPIPGEADGARQSRAVAHAIRSLRPEYREVLLETYYHGRSVAEAAAVLGIAAETVKARAFRALRALKLALEERGLAP
jgi:RNA polymerase sigma-70 factor (ECF subfamily)